MGHHFPAPLPRRTIFLRWSGGLRHRLISGEPSAHRMGLPEGGSVEPRTTGEGPVKT